jgi:putative peptidoglycan lipid II flippase
VALVLFPMPLVVVLYHYGHFTATDVQQTVLALMGYGIGLMGLVGVKVLAPGFYAQQDIRTPVRIAVTVLILTQLMNLLFVPYLGHAGLALSIGLGATLNAGWLLVGLRQRGSYRPAAGWRPFLLRIALACGVMGTGLWGIQHRIDWIALQAHAGLRVALLAGVLIAAAGLYFGTLLASGLRLRSFIQRA